MQDADGHQISQSLQALVVVMRQILAELQQMKSRMK